MMITQTHPGCMNFWPHDENWLPKPAQRIVKYISYILMGLPTRKNTGSFREEKPSTSMNLILLNPVLVWTLLLFQGSNSALIVGLAPPKTFSRQSNMGSTEHLPGVTKLLGLRFRPQFDHKWHRHMYYKDPCYLKSEVDKHISQPCLWHIRCLSFVNEIDQGTSIVWTSPSIQKNEPNCSLVGHCKIQITCVTNLLNDWFQIEMQIHMSIFETYSKYILNKCHAKGCEWTDYITRSKPMRDRCSKFFSQPSSNDPVVISLSSKTHLSILLDQLSLERSQMHK